MNILITGSNGFVGSKLMWNLETDGHTVVGLDISNHCDARPHPETLQGDIRVMKDLQSLAGSFELKHNASLDVVIHCAASKHDFGISRGEYFSHNKYGTKSLLAFMEQRKIDKLIYISTVSVFGHPEGKADENTPYNPDHPYGESKLAGELLSREWQAKFPSRALTVLRPTVIYGPHNFANVYNLIAMLHKRPYLTVGDGSHVKSIVSLSTVVDMIRFALNGLKPGYEHYNCIDEPYITLHELMRIITQTPGFRMPRVQIPLKVAIGIGKLFDIPSRLLGIDLPVNSDRMKKFGTATYFTADKIRKQGFVQQQSIETSVGEMCQWYLSTNQDRR